MSGTHDIERTPQYEEFIGKLKEFHEKRGTHLDTEPKLGLNHVDLYRLFNYIVERGGYDKVSDEKLAWRRMCEGLGLMTGNAPAAAFGLKTIFYKFLAAYEIKTIHNKEPPPPEILEQLTARGSGLLTRTLETYKANRRDTIHERSDGDENTPVKDRKLDDTPGSARSSRGLREAPPQRVIFQPDTAPPRQARHASSQHAAPTARTSHPSPHTQAHPHAHGHIQSPHVQPMQHQPQIGGPSQAWNPQNAEPWLPAVQNYRPAELAKVDSRVVPTPINTPEAFPKSRRLASAQAAAMQPRFPGSKLNTNAFRSLLILATVLTVPRWLRGAEHLPTLRYSTSKRNPVRTSLWPPPFGQNII
jgi:chromatin structure-remodeling complex subunit RSC9